MDQNPEMSVSMRQQELNLRQQMLLEARQRNQLRPKLSVRASLVRALTATPNTYYSGLPIVLDVSHWNEVVNWAGLAGLIEGGVAKLGEVDDTTDPDLWPDDTFISNVQGAYDANVPLGAYVFVNTADWVRRGVDKGSIDNLENSFDKDPVKGAAYAKAVINQDPQMRLILRQLVIGDSWMTDPTKLLTLPKRKVYFLALDVERWWLHYNDYYANKGGSATKRIDDGGFWIAYSTKILMERLRHFMMLKYLPTMPILIYSAGWVVNGYSPVNLRTLLDNHPDNWLAHYYFSTVTNTTVPLIRSEQLTKIPDTWKPTYLYGGQKMYQLADCFTIPQVTNKAGAPSRVDLNVWLAPKDQMYNFIGFTGTTPPPPPPPPPDTGGGTTTPTDLTPVLNKIAELRADINKALRLE